MLVLKAQRKNVYENKCLIKSQSRFIYCILLVVFWPNIPVRIAALFKNKNKNK